MLLPERHQIGPESSVDLLLRRQSFIRKVTDGLDWFASFILSALDSKGLEFDDVIVAFDLGDRET